MIDEIDETRLAQIVAAMRQAFGERAYLVAAKQMEIARHNGSPVLPQWERIADRLRH